MTAPEWSPGVPVTGDNLQPVFMAALKAGDVRSVEDCLKLAAIVDPNRAADWLVMLKVATGATA